MNILLQIYQKYIELNPEDIVDQYLKDELDELFEVIYIPVSEDDIPYVKHLLLSAKGTTEVLELMKSHLGIDMTYEYDSFTLQLDLSLITSTDPNRLRIRLSNFTNTLLYYHNMKLKVRKLVMLIKQVLGKLTTQIQLLPFKFHEVTNYKPSCTFPVRKIVNQLATNQVWMYCSKEPILGRVVYLDKELTMLPEDGTYLIGGRLYNLKQGQLW